MVRLPGEVAAGCQGLSGRLSSPGAGPAPASQELERGPLVLPPGLGDRLHATLHSGAPSADKA